MKKPKLSEWFDVVEHYKQNGKAHGLIARDGMGDLYYFATRKHSMEHRGRARTISEAREKGLSGWAVDFVTLSEMRRRGVKFVGVQVTDTGESYLAAIEDYSDPAKTTAIDYRAKRGAQQKVLLRQHFTYTAGEPSFRACR